MTWRIFHHLESTWCRFLPRFATHRTSRIIPQAICVRYGLSIGAKCVPLVLCLMWTLGTSSDPLLPVVMNSTFKAPIAWPIAKLLDYVLGGQEHTTYKKPELRSFLQFHRTGEDPLRDDEITILNGVLELNTKKVEEIMTPIAVCAFNAIAASTEIVCRIPSP